MARPAEAGARAPRLAVSTDAVASARIAIRGLGPWLARSAPAGARGLVSLAVVSDARMRRMNREFRGVDRATDVLAFPAGDDRGRPRFLGDIAMAAGVAGRQARSHGHSLRTELRILALHGLLHLLGYDHTIDEGRMLRLEEQLRRRAGLPQALTGRVAGR